MFGGLAGEAEKEEIFEYVPEPTPSPSAPREGHSSSAPKAQGSSGANEGLDTRSSPAREAFGAFAKREAAALEGATGTASSSSSRRPRSEYESLGGSGSKGFEPPEQRLARLQADVADFIRLAESPGIQSGSITADEASELLGGEPASVAAELKALEQRLGTLARDGPPSWRGKSSQGGGAQASSMSQGLVARIERLAASGSASSTAPAAATGSSGEGRLTYEISYSPSPAALADSSRVAALESSIADIEKKLGVLDPASPISDIQTAVSQMQKRLSLLDTNKIDAISRRVHVVMNEVESMLIKKGELVDASDHNLDQKVGELYEFCHRWTSTASSLPSIVSRLQSLQGLHQQSASFVTRLQGLEQQQEELARLLETTNSAVQELGKSLQDNMTTVRDNMKTLEEKIAKAVKK